MPHLILAAHSLFAGVVVAPRGKELVLGALRQALLERRCRHVQGKGGGRGGDETGCLLWVVMQV